MSHLANAAWFSVLGTIRMMVGLALFLWYGTDFAIGDVLLPVVGGAHDDKAGLCRGGDAGRDESALIGNLALLVIVPIVD